VNAEQYRRLKELFHTAASLDEAKQQAFIAESCGDDTELRTELTSLLAHASGEPLLTHTRPKIVTRAGASTSRNSTRQSRVSIAQSWAWLTSPRMRWLRAWLPLLFATTVSVLIAWWLHERVRTTIAEARQHELLAILRGDVAAIGHLLDRERGMILSVAQSPDVRREVAALFSTAEKSAPPSTTERKAHPARESLLQHVRGVMGKNAEYAIWDRQMVAIIDATGDPMSGDDTTGRPVSERGATLLNRVFSGQTVVLRPDYNFMLPKSTPDAVDSISMGMLAPIYAPDADDRVIAAIMVRRRELLTAFDSILLSGRFENTVEAYVFSRQGTMHSESRFLEQLLEFGLLTKDEMSPSPTSRLKVRVKDPGGDLTQGFKPPIPRSAQPLTEMVRMAADNGAGVNVNGYRDYRGVTVIGAWDWLKDPDLGIAVEVNYEEAFRPVAYVRMGSIAAGALIFAWSIVLAVASIRTLRDRALIRRVGPYHLVRRIGKGGMGEVYLAEHSLLKRPTAVKLIRSDKTTSQTMA
jgi:hypothetical protein